MRLEENTGSQKTYTYSRIGGAKDVLLLIGCRLCHIVDLFVFIDHFSMFLFFCLNMIQQFTDIIRSKLEQIGIVVAGN